MEIIKFLYDKSVNKVFEPKGLTFIFQSLDVLINRSFKDAIRHEYEYEYTCSFFKSNINKR